MSIESHARFSRKKSNRKRKATYTHQRCGKSFVRPFCQSKADSLLHELNFALDQRINLVDQRKVLNGDYEGVGPWIAHSIRQQEALFKKNVGYFGNVVGSHGRAKNCLSTFLACEEMCRQFNTTPAKNPALEFEVSRLIAKVLGPAPTISSLESSTGPGASVGTSGFTSLRMKLNNQTVTDTCLKYVPELCEITPFLTEHYGKLVPGSKFSTVPKTALTDRPICTEPFINGYLQKGVGSLIKRRLKERCGIDISCQSEVNKKMARRASRWDTHATIDLSSASDTISRKLVERILPFDWWVLLYDLRSHYVVLPDGQKIFQEKFSSMGNGFTFELETLIFWATCIVSCEHRRLRSICVFGDDMIVPSRYADNLVSNLHDLGFKVNNEKSFTRGSFRESCGGDFVKGVDIRPVYLKETPSIEILYSMYNGFISRNDVELASIVLRYIPRLYRLWGPAELGDSVLHGPYERWQIKQRKSNYEYIKIRAWVFGSKPYKKPGPWDYVAFLSACANSGPDGSGLTVQRLNPAILAGQSSAVPFKPTNHFSYNERDYGSYEARFVWCRSTIRDESHV